jgi:hypothetical protein
LSNVYTRFKIPLVLIPTTLLALRILLSVNPAGIARMSGIIADLASENRALKDMYVVNCNRS